MNQAIETMLLVALVSFDGKTLSFRMGALCVAPNDFLN